jgi:hypothetical protein
MADETAPTAADNAQQQTGGAAPTAPPARPDGIPEQFWDAKAGQINHEALVKSWKDTRAELLQVKSKAPQSATGLSLEQPAAAKLAEDASVPQILQHVGFTEQQIIEAVQANDGKLTTEMYKAFYEKAGYSRAVVDTVIAREASDRAGKVKTAISAAHEQAGGQEQFDNLLAFGRSLPEGEKGAIQALLDKPETVADAVDLLLAKHKRAVGAGKANALIGGDGGSSGGGGAFTSQMQIVQAQNDPRYFSDPGFRKQVNDRIQLSPPAANLPLR